MVNKSNVIKVKGKDNCISVWGTFASAAVEAQNVQYRFFIVLVKLHSHTADSLQNISALQIHSIHLRVGLQKTDLWGFKYGL